MTVATQRIATHLRSAILGGALGPGDRVRQEDIAQQLGASRLPVREALQILAAEGLIENEPNKGARVPRLGMHEGDVMYRMRAQREPLALPESLPDLDDSDLQELARIQAEIESDDDVDAFLDLDRQFHLLTYSGCRIEPLNTAVHRLWNSTQHYRRAFVQLSGPGRMWVVNAEHRLILDAVARRDETDGARSVSGHPRRTRSQRGQHPDGFGHHP